MGARAKVQEQFDSSRNGSGRRIPNLSVVAKEAAPEESSQTAKLTPLEIENIIVTTRDDARRMAWRLLTSWRVRMHDDDVMSVVGMALCEAANRFDPTRGVNFKTFFFYHLRGLLIKEITAMFHEQKACELVPPELLSDTIPGEQQAPAGWFFKRIDADTPERLMQRREVAALFEDACLQLDDLEREVIERSFFGDEQLVDIAEELGYCRCHISRVKSRAITVLRKSLDAYHGLDQVVSESSRGKSNAAVRKYTGGRGRRKTRSAVDKAA